MHRIALAFVIASCAPALHELPVPDVRQSTDYTCSASALQAVFAYYGIEATEDELAKELGATPKDGAPPDAIVRVARAHGLTADARDDMTIDDLARELAQRRPTIVDLEAWADPPRTSWADDWDDGHYVILVAIDGDQLVFEDPSVLGSRSVLRKDELAARWHDEDNGRRHRNTGIVFGGKPPAPPRARVHMD